MFNESKLKEILARAQKENEKSGGNERRQTGPNLFWQSEGTHKIRVFHDKSGELYRHVLYHKVGKNRFLCPSILKRADPAKYGHLPDCKVCETHRELDSHYRTGLGVNSRYLYWIQILQSTANSDFFPVGKFGVGLMKKKFHDSFTNLVTGMAAESPQQVVSLLNPNAKTFPMQAIIIGGQQGSVNFSVLPFTPVDPIELDDTYCNLTEVSYIPMEFDEEAYKKGVEAALEVKAQWVKEETPQSNEANMAQDAAPQSTSTPQESAKQEETPWVDESNTKQPAVQQSEPAKDTPTVNADGSTIVLVNSTPVTVPADLSSCFGTYPGVPKCYSCNLSIQCMTKQMTR